MHRRLGIIVRVLVALVCYAGLALYWRTSWDMIYAGSYSTRLVDIVRSQATSSTQNGGGKTDLLRLPIGKPVTPYGSDSIVFISHGLKCTVTCARKPGAFVYTVVVGEPAFVSRTLLVDHEGIYRHGPTEWTASAITTSWAQRF